MYAERLLPHDIDAEESVIGSILIDSDSINKVSPFLKPADFYSEKNRWCLDACISLSDRDEAINQVTVAHELSLQDRLESLGGTSYFSHLVMVVPTSVHIEYYARIVQRTSIMRQLIRTGGDIAAIGYEGGPDADVVLSKAEDLLFGVRSGRDTRDFTHLREVLDTYMGRKTAGELMDLALGHSVHHLKQLYEYMSLAGMTPVDRLEQADFEGIAVPTELF